MAWTFLRQAFLDGLSLNGAAIASPRDHAQSRTTRITPRPAGVTPGLIRYRDKQTDPVTRVRQAEIYRDTCLCDMQTP